MNHIFTLKIAALKERNACLLDERIKELTQQLRREVAMDESVPLRVWWVLPSTSVHDRWWSLAVAEPHIEVDRQARSAMYRTLRRLYSRQEAGEEREYVANLMECVENNTQMESYYSLAFYVDAAIAKIASASRYASQHSVYEQLVAEHKAQQKDLDLAFWGNDDR